MIKVLVYGFEPFGKSDNNISKEVVEQLQPEKNVKTRKIILPVYFKKSILNSIESFQPDVIIGLGQKNRGKLLEMERTARNKYDLEGAKPIRPRGPARLFLTLKLCHPPKGLRTDYQSGSYVCNFTRYVVANYIRKNHLPTKSTFLHIPKKMEVDKATKIVQKVLHDIAKDGVLK